MDNTIPVIRSRKTAQELQFLMAIFITLFLCFIDEGAYSFSELGKGLLDPGNWPIMVIMIALFFGLQVFVEKFILLKYKGSRLTLYSMLISILFLLALLMSSGLLYMLPR